MLSKKHSFAAAPQINITKKFPSIIVGNLMLILMDQNFQYFDVTSPSLFRITYSELLFKQYSESFLPRLENFFLEKKALNEHLHKIEDYQLKEEYQLSIKSIDIDNNLLRQNAKMQCAHALGGVLKYCFQNSSILNLNDVRIVCSLNILIKQLTEIFKFYEEKITSKQSSITLKDTHIEFIQRCFSDFLGQLTFLDDKLAASVIHNFIFVSQVILKNQSELPEPLAYGVCIAPVLREGLSLDFKIVLPKECDEKSERNSFLLENRFLSHVVAALLTYPKFKQAYKASRYDLYRQDDYNAAFELMSELKVKHLNNPASIISKFKKLDINFNVKINEIERESPVNSDPIEQVPQPNPMMMFKYQRTIPLSLSSGVKTTRSDPSITSPRSDMFMKK